ncbi:helix-turn-helix domain-containing protein [Variovorax sp. R-27]|uniref:helix-turn-helix domain-containing protein n=1 Tax=Variovorax sp. R-27 TaxID=3404058 RepID=UPI003CF2B795
MDKRRKSSDATHEMELRDALYRAISSGKLPVGQSVAAMRRMSKLTQPEFATHRGLSVQSLRAIEADKANPTVDTLNKVAGIFGLQVGFVPKDSQRESWRDVEHALKQAADHLQNLKDEQ